jgi:hypothetical protein
LPLRRVRVTLCPQNHAGMPKYGRKRFTATTLDASLASQVAPETLRSWERAGLVHAERTPTGHRSIEMTLNVYSHCLPSMEQDAAERLAAMLHG